MARERLLKCATATRHIPHDSQTPRSTASFLGAICRDLNPIYCARKRGCRTQAARKDSCGNDRSLGSPGTGTRPPPSQNIEYSLLHVAALASCRPSSPNSPTQSAHNSIPWTSSPCAPPRATVGSPDTGYTLPRPLRGHRRVGQQMSLEASLAGRSRGNLSSISDKGPRKCWYIHYRGGPKYREEQIWATLTRLSGARRDPSGWAVTCS